VGNDLEDRYCTSDNFRISNLMQHSIQSYFDSAINISPKIVEKGIEPTNERTDAVEAAKAGIPDPCKEVARGKLQSR